MSPRSRRPVPPRSGLRRRLVRRAPFGPLLLLATALLGACGAPAWAPLRPVPPRRLPATQLVRLWSDGRELTWRAVALGADSVSGVPWQQDPGCIPCRLVLPLAAIDSLRTGTTDARGIGAAATAGLIVAGLGLLLRTMWAGD